MQKLSHCRQAFVGRRTVRSDDRFEYQGCKSDIRRTLCYTSQQDRALHARAWQEYCDAHFMRILVVDDTLRVLKMTHDMLINGGYEVVCASSGRDSIEIVNRQRFDLVLIHVVMEGMNGPQAARTIRHTCPDLPIMFMTGFPDQLEALRTETVIEKPFPGDRLLKLVRKILSRRFVKERA